MSRSLHRMILAFVIGAVLLGSWPAAAHPRPRVQPSLESRITLTPLDLLSRLWAALVERALEKTGCSIDPHGACASNTPETDTGCSLDPHGVCASGH